MEQKLLRIIDANLNRTREGLRTCEDIARFTMCDKGISMSLKSIRHGATRAFLRTRGVSLKELALSRDTERDVLRFRDFKKQKTEKVTDIFMSNIERAKESLRVLEECSKILDQGLSRRYRRLRFDTYDVEKKSVKKIAALRNKS